MYDPLWYLTKDGDRSCYELFRRHYSCRNLRPKKGLFVGPGEKIVLRTDGGDAVFVWRQSQFRSDGQEGVECTLFRNESQTLSSQLVRQADAIADHCWPGERHYTFVNPEAVRSSNPGYCFLAAGWRRCGETQRGLLILERIADSTPNSGSDKNASSEEADDLANNALWLDGWTVATLERGDTETIAEATFDAEPKGCPKCGVVGRLYRHGTKNVRYRDIPTFGKPLVIKATVNRYRCRECAATFMQSLPTMDNRRRMTGRLVDYILEQGIEQTYSAVARHIDVDEKTIRNICDEHVQMAVRKNLEEAPIIFGMDELTIKGRKRTVFVDVANKRLLDIIDSRAKGAVTRWMSWMPDRERVRVVTVDMWGAYREVAYGLLPNAVVVADKWHVVKKANEALDAVRSRFRKGAKGKLRKNPRRGRLIMHITPSKLSPMRRVMLDALLDNNPLLKDGWQAKEGFYAIWQATDRTEAERRFDEWEASIPDSVPEFRALAKTVNDWHTEVFNYFDHRFTNAYTEARNRIIKDLIRAGRGYSFDRIRAKALLKQPITSKPLLLCESCLGTFPSQAFIDTHHIRPTKGRQPGNVMRLCANCHWRIHTAEGLLHDVRSTPKSE
jgi:transposase